MSRDHYDSMVSSRRPKKLCVGSPDRPACSEMIIDYGQRNKCLECLESVRRTNAKRYGKARRLKNQASNDQQHGA